MSITTTKSSPFVKARSVGLTDARWMNGFWGDRFELCAKSIVPAMGRLMTESERYRFLGNFEVASGDVEGRHRGPKWNDGDFYKWIEAAAALLAAAKDDALDRRLDEVIGVIALAQRSDGYLHTPVQILALNGDRDAEPFQNSLDFEAYNLGH